MAFALEDILEGMAEASRQGRREWLDSGAFRFIKRGRVKDYMTAEQYRRWLIKCARANKKWKARHALKYLMQVRAYRRTQKYKAWEREYHKLWRLKNPERAKATDKRRRQNLKADPARLEKRRQQNRESSRRYRAKQKCLSQTKKS